MGYNLCICQGDYAAIAASMGGVSEMAQHLAQFDVVALSHISTENDTTFPNACGCVDTAYADMPQLIAEIKAANPSTKIFGYASGTADAPTGCGYGPGNTYDDNGWTPPGGIASNFMHWVGRWDGLGIDGILIDLVAPQYLAPGTRDSIYSWCRYKGYKIMANTTYPDAVNLDFAAVGLGSGDFLLIEGWVYGGGVSTLAGTNSAIYAMNALRSQGVNMAALCSKGWGAAFDNSDVENANGTSMFGSFGWSGDVYQYCSSDLGIVNKRLSDKVY